MLIPLTILWSVFFWIFDSVLTKNNFLELREFFLKPPPESSLELMFFNYPFTHFLIRITFALFMIAAALIIYDFYKKEKRTDITFRKVFENSKDMIFLLSSSGKIRRLNKASEELLDHDQLVDQIDEILIPASSMEIGQLMMSRDGEARFLAKSIINPKQTFDCVTSCIDREKDDYLLMARDITETLKMNQKLKSLNEDLLSSYEELESSYEEIEQNILEEKNRLIEHKQQELEKAFKDIQQSEERYESLYKSNEYIMQSIPEMIVRFNKKGDIVWMNKAFKQRFELIRDFYNIGEIKVNAIPLIEEKIFQRIWCSERSNDFTLRLGEDLILNVVTVPAVEQDEIIMIMLDITKIRMREEYFKNAKKAADEAAEMKDEFIAKISHELRTPMNGIVTAVNLMNYMQRSLDTEIEEYLTIIDTSSKRLMTTINELLDISKLEKGLEKIKVERIDLYNLLEGVKSEFTVFAKQKNLKLTTALEGDVPRYCYSDREKINHIISNLIFNAIKFTLKGFVKLLIKGTRIDKERYELTFYVMDSGIGIPKDKQEKVFEKFSQVDNSYTREFEGTGLGLAISQGTAKVLNSMIKLQSEEGKGTTFYFSVIVKEGHPEISSESKVPLEKYMNKIKDINPLIFVAEDDPINAKLLEKTLKKYGCRSKIHHNAMVLLESLKTKLPDIILMDIEMPGMNGMDATKLIKTNQVTQSIPVIALSAHAFDREKEKSFESGIDDYLTKPINQKLLLETLLKYLE